MAEIFHRLEGKRLKRGAPYRPTQVDNQKAWAAVEKHLDKMGDKGALYYILAAAAKVVAPSVGRRFIDYLVRNGHLELVPSQ